MAVDVVDSGMGTSLQLRMRRLFVEGFTAMDVAESLVSFDHEQDARAALQIAQIRGLQVVGVQSAGLVSGFALVGDLDEAGTLGAHGRLFEENQILEEDAHVGEMIGVLDEHEFCFLSVLGSVAAVVGRADVEKPPVRMWLFGMVTIAEMFFNRRIRELHPDDSWTDLISENRVLKARQLLDERRRRNRSGSLVDCLQFPDKAQILLKNAEMRADFGFQSVREGVAAVKQFEGLRNHLAHSQSIVEADWQTIVGLSGRVDRILTRI